MDDQRQFSDTRPPFSPVDDQEQGPMKQSGIGIASFILGVVGIAALIALTAWVVGVIANEIDFSGIFDENGNQLMTEEELTEKVMPLLGYLLLYPLIIVIDLIGLILGIIGLARSGYKKTFAALGTAFNGLVMLGVFVLLIIGLTAG